MHFFFKSMKYNQKIILTFFNKKNLRSLKKPKIILNIYMLGIHANIYKG